ncbi:hypothetical protein D3C72_501170 [compost metagenome]
MYQLIRLPVFPGIEDLPQFLKVLCLLLNDTQRLTLLYQGIGERIDFTLTEILMEILNTFMQRSCISAYATTTNQQHRFMLGDRSYGRHGQYRTALAWRCGLGDDPFPEKLTITRPVAQGTLPFLAHGMEQGGQEPVSIVDWQACGIAHLILPGGFVNHDPHLPGVLRPGAATQFAIERALADLDAQAAEGVGVDAQGAQHQALGVDVDQCIVVQTLGGADRLRLEQKLARLGFHAQRQALVLCDLLALGRCGAMVDFFRDGFRQPGEFAEQRGDIGGLSNASHRCTEVLQGIDQQWWRGRVLHMHPAQRGFFSGADQANPLQLLVTESIGGVTDSAHQRRAFPVARVLRLADPGTLTVVPQGRGIGIGSLRMVDSVLPGCRVCFQFEQLAVQP